MTEMAIKSQEEALTVLESCITGLDTLIAQYPEERLFRSARIQLDFIKGPLERMELIAPADQARLNFGYIGIRFVREDDEQLGRQIASLAGYVRQHLYGGAGTEADSLSAVG